MTTNRPLTISNFKYLARLSILREVRCNPLVLQVLFKPLARFKTSLNCKKLRLEIQNVCGGILLLE